MTNIAVHMYLALQLTCNKILVQVKKWSGRTIFSHLNLVQADQFWLPKLVQPTKNGPAQPTMVRLENRCHLLYMDSVGTRDYANSINVSMHPSLILSVAHYTIPATFSLASKQLFCNSPFFFGYASNSCLNST